MLSHYDQTANAEAVTSSKEEQGLAIVIRHIMYRNNILE